MSKNRVVVKTESDVAKRTILETIGELTGAFIKEPKEELVIEMDIESQVLMEILKSLIIQRCLSLVSIDTMDYSEKAVLYKEEEVVDIDKAEEIVKLDESIISEIQPKEESSKNLKETILSFIKDKKTASNVEIVQVTNCTPQHICRVLANLEKEGKIEKITRGVWKIKETNQTSYEQKDAKEDTKKVKEETKEEAKKEAQEEEIKVSNFGIFDKEEYFDLINYIMSKPKFTEYQLKSKFPEQKSKIPVVLNGLEGKYIRQHKEYPDGHYEVFNKIRVLYYILNHEGSTFSSIKEGIKDMSAQVISDILNNCIRNKNVILDNNVYVVIRM